MADLAGQAARPAVEPAVEDEPGRDAGPDREVREVVGRAEDAPSMEPDRGGTGVVLDDARAAETAFEARRRSGEVVPAEVDRERHVAGQRVDAAGHADADDRDVGRVARRRPRARGR